MTVDWSSLDRYRYTLTLTPMTEDDIQAVLDDIRARFGRAPLVHVIDKRDRHSRLNDVCPQAKGETDCRSGDGDGRCVDPRCPVHGTPDLIRDDGTLTGGAARVAGTEDQTTSGGDPS